MSDVRIVVQVSEAAPSDPNHQCTRAVALIDALVRALAEEVPDLYHNEELARAFDLIRCYLAQKSHWRGHIWDAVNEAVEVQEDGAGISWRETLKWVTHFWKVADHTEAEVAELFEMDLERVRMFRQVVSILLVLAADILAPITPE